MTAEPHLALQAARHPLRLVSAALIVVVSALIAEESSAASVPPGPAYHSIGAQRIEASEAPVIDGILSEPAWANAAVIDQLYQRSPNTGDPGTEETTIRILYDENNLYFGIYAYDQNPGEIDARAMFRDGNMFSSDNILIKLDPGLTRRNGYTFQVSAAGGRRDGLLQNNSDSLYEWNAIWDAKVQIVEDGWIAEIAIPFRSISYDPNQTDWGFDIGRFIRHKNESVMWSAYTPTLGGNDLTLSGTMTGITGSTSGLGLDVQVYGSASLRHVVPGTEGTDLSGTGGGNLYYKITPALTGTLTYNPDFSDSPLDARQVNTTRFSLFFDETRDFFLQDASAFEFGGLNFTNNANNARPFFSRNIGLVSGVPVGIIGGGKLSGEYAGFGIGALSVLTAAQADAPKQVLSVARITHPIFSESNIGIVATNGDPTGESNNTVLGADFQYRDSNFMGETVFQTDLYYERSFSSLDGYDHSYGATINFPNEPWGARFRFKEVGENFRPALGFANRTGIRAYEGRLVNRNRFRDRRLRQAVYSAEVELITGLDNLPQSWEGQYQAEFETPQNDRISLRIYDYFERIPEEFTVADTVPIFEGDYGWTNYGVRLQSSGGRSVQAGAGFECCRFYNGDGFELQANVNWRPSRYFELQPEYEGTIIRLPTGSVDIHILTLDSLVNFTPDMQLAVEVQWDNITEGFTFSGRFLWEYSPGNELFVGLGQTAIIPTNFMRFEPQTSLFSVRLGQTFQF